MVSVSSSTALEARLVFFKEARWRSFTISFKDEEGRRTLQARSSGPSWATQHKTPVSFKNKNI